MISGSRSPARRFGTGSGKDAIENEDVKVWGEIERASGPLDDRHGSRARGEDSLLFGLGAQPGEDRGQAEGEDGALELVVEDDPVAARDRERDHPLPHAGGAEGRATHGVSILQFAESHLTRSLFGQMLGRTERLASHPTSSRGQRVMLQKALRLDLDAPTYGAFAEIGAGQEVARSFFQVGVGSSRFGATTRPISRSTRRRSWRGFRTVIPRGKRRCRPLSPRSSRPRSSSAGNCAQPGEDSRR